MDISLSNNSIQAMGYDAQTRPVELDAPFMQAEASNLDGARTKTDVPEVETAPKNTGETFDATSNAQTQKLNSMFLETGIGSITERLA